MQKDPRDKGLKLCIFVFLVFLHDLNDLNDRSEPDVMFSVSPVNATCACNSAKAKMLKGLGQRFHQFARLLYKVLQRKSFLTNA